MFSSRSLFSSILCLQLFASHGFRYYRQSYKQKTTNNEEVGNDEGSNGKVTKEEVSDSKVYDREISQGNIITQEMSEYIWVLLCMYMF